MAQKAPSQPAFARQASYLRKGASHAAVRQASRAEQWGDLWALTRALLVLFGGVALVALALV